MRIIAGTARRTALVAPKGLDTRPTSDMARESLFNILSALVRGARFLDLFSGSGAVGLEALSRGAKEAVFVENAGPAIAALMQNLEKTKLAPAAEVLKIPAEKAIDNLSTNGRQFDIIFLDPPYDTNLLSLTLAKLAGANILAKDGIIVAETDSKLSDSLKMPEMLELTDTRIYGRSCFMFMQLLHVF